MRNDNCTTCGGFGYTIDTDHTMTGCHECFVAAHEADNAAKMLNEFEPGSPEYIHYEEVA